MNSLLETELILNPDGSIYHLNLLPGDIADNVILVGDPGRVEMVSSLFDSVEIKKEKREFITHTGNFRGKGISVISTGIGTDNIDIVVNELDALANIDIRSRKVKGSHRKLSIIRIGTCGSVQPDIPVDSFVMSELAIGFDGLLNFYDRRDEVCNIEFEKAFKNSVGWGNNMASPYVVRASEILFNRLNGDDMISGVTISAPGFYGPQGRQLRLGTADPRLNRKIENFRWNRYRICNYEMECSAIYGLSKLLGHEAVTVCAVVANRISGTFSKVHEDTILKLINRVLYRLADSNHEKEGHTGTYTSA